MHGSIRNAVHQETSGIGCTETDAITCKCFPTKNLRTVLISDATVFLYKQKLLLKKLQSELAQLALVSEETVAGGQKKTVIRSYEA